MKILITVITVLCLVSHVISKCDPENFTKKVEDGADIEVPTPVDGVAVMVCGGQQYPNFGNFNDADSTVYSLTCTAGTDDAADTDDDVWKPTNDLGFVGDVKCIACVGNDECENGICNDYGTCICDNNYKKSADDETVCEKIVCSTTLSNLDVGQDAKITDVDPDTPVTIDCAAGTHVTGVKGTSQQTSTCKDTGYFDPLFKDCVVCDDNTDCTGATCDSNNMCICDDKYVFDGDSKTVCVELTCPVNYCSNNGACSVPDNANSADDLVCACVEGTSAPDTKCATIDNPQCDNNPCQHGGTCNYDTSDYTQITCECSDQYTGDNCEYAKQFYFDPSGDGLALASLSASSVQFKAIPAGNGENMYIAIFKVIDVNDNPYKVIVRKVDSEIETTVIQLGPGQDYSILVTHSTASTPAITYKIEIDGANSDLLFTVNDGTAERLDVKDFESLSEIRIGGSCGWDQDCSGLSNVYYTKFIGTLSEISKDGAVLPFNQVTGATVGALTCDNNNPCGSGATCADDDSVIQCTCTNGYTGFYCNGLVQMSFNGYTHQIKSTKFDVPISASNSLQFSFTSGEDEDASEGMIELAISDSCNIKVTLENGVPKIGTTELTVSGEVVTLELDGSDVKQGGVTVDSCSFTTDQISQELEFTLGGVSTGSEPGPQSELFQGCIKQITWNGLNIFTTSNFDVSASDKLPDLTQCVNNLIPHPDNRCTDLNDCNSAASAENECVTDDEHWTASCSCTAPWTAPNTNCNYLNYCTSAAADHTHTCVANQGDCVSFDTIEKCKAHVNTTDANCADDVTWYYFCLCKDGWEGINCETESGDKEPVVGGNSNTTIIVVVVVVAALVIVVGIIFIVRRKKAAAGANQDEENNTNGKQQKSYSPQQEESKMQDISSKPEEKNIYNDIDNVIVNPNAESSAVLDLPEPVKEPPAPEPVEVEPALPQYPVVDHATVEIEPNYWEEAGERNPEGPPPDPI